MGDRYGGRNHDGDVEGKMFIGGLSWETTQEKLQDYFSKYGELTDSVVMRDGPSGRSRGFGFVTYKNPDDCDRVIEESPHTLDGRSIDPKLAVSRAEQARGHTFRTKKIFVGGLSPSTTEETITKFFSQFGEVTETLLMYDKATNRPRGFAFVSFEKELSVDKLVQKPFHEIDGKTIEVKKAEPKGQAPPPPRGGGYDAPPPRMSDRYYGGPRSYGSVHDRAGPPPPQRGPGGYRGYPGPSGNPYRGAGPPPAAASAYRDPYYNGGSAYADPAPLPYSGGGYGGAPAPASSYASSAGYSTGSSGGYGGASGGYGGASSGGYGGASNQYASYDAAGYSAPPAPAAPASVSAGGYGGYGAPKTAYPTAAPPARQAAYASYGQEAAYDQGAADAYSVGQYAPAPSSYGHAAPAPAGRTASRYNPYSR